VEAPRYRRSLLRRRAHEVQHLRYAVASSGAPVEAVIRASIAEAVIFAILAFATALIGDGGGEAARAATRYVSGERDRLVPGVGAGGRTAKRARLRSERAESSSVVRCAAASAPLQRAFPAVVMSPPSLDRPNRYSCGDCGSGKGARAWSRSRSPVRVIVWSPVVGA
jgi:hypothetical protein